MSYHIDHVNQPLSSRLMRTMFTRNVKTISVESGLKS